MIIGRKEELERLNRAYNSDQAEFVAVYGRRRIGKTFLIREAFNNNFFFTYTGAHNVSTREQLTGFHSALVRQSGKSWECPASWRQAFDVLMDYIESSDEKRKIIFLDELPWMDGPRSSFVSALENFWNGRASARKDVMLIVCGSASSWIIQKIFRNKGGLHNRVTCRIHLHHFTLHEVEEFAEYHKLGYSRAQILEGYMVMGGVPFYWTKLLPSKSMAQNINDLFINADGEMRYEFKELYSSIFNNPDRYIAVIEALSTKKKGLTREEIIKSSKIENNGHLSRILDDLIECGFIRKYCHTDKKLKDALYQLVDCYTLFYYQFVKGAHGTDEDYWLKLQNTPTYNTWCGLAFERVCLLHTRQIKFAMGISGIIANIYSWHVAKNDEHPGVQIDLLIDRADNVISLCEMKYAPNGYVMTKAEADKIRTRVRVFSQFMSSRKSLQLVLVASNGMVNNKNAVDFQRILTADDLFVE
jgi:hypothetical protein